MLYLRSLTADAEPSQVPLADATAEALEQVLLAGETANAERVFAAAIDSDAAFGEWALREAAAMTSGARDQAFVAHWWCDRLATKLADRLVSDEESTDFSHIEGRLPALVAKLHACEITLASFDARLEHEKLESLKELAYGAGHEVNNPLANIAARAQTLLADEPDSERKRKLTAIHRQAMRAHEMIADLMLFARPPQVVRAECDLNQLVRQVVDEYTDRAAERSIVITCGARPEPLSISIDAPQIAVAISAVVNNAIEAIGTRGGHVAVETRTQQVAGERWAEVTVRDDGPGISPEVRRHIFDPFFSGREAGRGLGFGLSKCWRIVTDHGGRILVNSVTGSGAEFTIVLPRTSPAH